MRHITSAIVATLVFAVSGSAWAQKLELKIFTLSHRPAVATVEIVKMELSPQGSVIPEQRLNRLFIRDTPEVLARITKLLEQIDTPAPIVSIQINSSLALPVSNQSTAAVGLDRRGRVNGTLQNNQVQGSATSQQTVMVISGEKAHIVVGEQLVYVQPFYNFFNGHGLIPGGVVFQDVTTGFAVEPTVMGPENIRLTVTPWISYRSPQGPGQIEMAQAASTVVIRRGESMVIAASQQASEITRNAFGLILGTQSESSSRSVMIEVSANVVSE